MERGGVSLLPGATYGFFQSIIADTLSRLRLRPSEQAFIARFVPLVAALLKTPGCAGDGLVRILASGVYRRAGRTEDAVRVAGFSAPPELEPHRQVMIGLALRAKGDYTGAESAFRAGYKASGDATHIVECARARWEGGDLRGTMELLEWAPPRLGGPDEEVAGMLRYLRGRVGGDASAASLVMALGNDASPDDFALQQYFEVGSLEAPPDATIGILRQAKAQGLILRPEDLRLKLSSIEAPSVRLVAALVLTGTPNPKVVHYEFESVPRPDPRLSNGNPRFLSWGYDGGVPRQACPAPPHEVQMAVNALAREPYYLPRWWKRAAEISPTLGAGAASHVVASMVFPSPPPEGVTPWDWVRHVQFASGLILARLDGEWRIGEGRQALMDILEGPIDWVMDAAVVGLVERALDDPATLDEIAAALERLRSRIPEQGHWSLQGSLPLAYLRLPGRPVEERQLFRGIARGYFEIEDRDRSGKL